MMDNICKKTRVVFEISNKFDMAISTPISLPQMPVEATCYLPE